MLITMKRNLFILIFSLVFVNFVFAQTDAGEFLKNKQTAGNNATDLQTNAQNYFIAVVNQDSEGVYRFLHPNYVQSLKGKEGALEFIESEFETSKDVDLQIVGVKIKPATVTTNSIISPQKIKVAVAFKTGDKIATLDGEVTAVSLNNKWYFVHQKTILESFGVKEFEEKDSGKTTNSGVLNGKAISLPAPEYPKAASAAGIQGTVNVEVVVNEQGFVISAEALSGHNVLRKAAVDAAKQARFQPTTVNGQIVKVKGIIVYNFSK